MDGIVAYKQYQSDGSIFVVHLHAETLVVIHPVRLDANTDYSFHRMRMFLHVSSMCIA
jgi:hypothetical protein